MMTLTRYGLREWGTAGLITLVILIGCWYLIRHGHPEWGWPVAGVVVVLFLAFAAFFRNPSRTRAIHIGSKSS